eukprot:TRINITY_DN26814_c0_g1_i1.p1 TRINITY_DN26814_c0_g1~~TRINITY_DN26814_c0_g1_i1.p1  ORF type:complete len:1074 (+),score=210.71 TRINITY_DN26814_c0_g1_i1:123-3344(+)
MDSADSLNPRGRAWCNAGRKAFFAWLAVSLSVTSSSALLAIGLWSDMGCGSRCLEQLQGKRQYVIYPLSSSILILLVLYLLDFFAPPHIQGRYFVLHENDPGLGRCLFCLTLLGLIVALFFAADQFPTAPLVITIFVCPVLLISVRQILKPKPKKEKDTEVQMHPKEVLCPKCSEKSPAQGLRPKSGRRCLLESKTDTEKDHSCAECRKVIKAGERQMYCPRCGHVSCVGHFATFQQLQDMLQKLTGEDDELRRFFLALTVSLASTGLLSIVCWIPWAYSQEAWDDRLSRDMEPIERELLFVRWATPLIVGISFIFFATFTSMRLIIDISHDAEDPSKRLSLLRLSRHSELRALEIEPMPDQPDSPLTPEDKERRKKKDEFEKEKFKRVDAEQKRIFKQRRFDKQLRRVVKTIGCSFIASLGAMYIAFQLTAADSHIADMVQSLLAAFFLTFVAFTYMAFKSMWKTMRSWLRHLPLIKSLLSMAEADSARTFALCFVLPLLPLLLGLSCLNQAVRRLRGVLDEEDRAQGETQTRSLITGRTQKMLHDMLSWNWVSMASWAYVVGFVMMLYKVIPLFLNVLLAWMNGMVANLHFVGILAFTFCAGMFLFMLPPVPGPPIYLFGGLVISEHCPYGFWWGSIICIILCIVLKLTACAVQQKVIGERLGSRQYIIQAVGVHRPFIRAIEQVLRRKGLSFGKCMILCGGPDWPTSVLAGILRLSLVQCLIGTLPVIFSTVPLALTGSFYLKRQESELWMRAGNLMFSLTALVSITFWAGMGWAIQDVFDKHSDELTAPKVEFLKLDWLDYKQGKIREQCRLSMRDLPLAMRCAHFGGAVLIVAVAQFFFWFSNSCFASFKVTDDVSKLRWLPDGSGSGSAMIKLPGLIGLCVVLVGFVLLLISRAWRARRVQKLTQQLLERLDGEYEQWEEDRLKLIRDWKETKSPKYASSEEAKSPKYATSEEAESPKDATSEEALSPKDANTEEQPESAIEVKGVTVLLGHDVLEGAISSAGLGADSKLEQLSMEADTVEDLDLWKAPENADPGKNFTVLDATSVQRKSTSMQDSCFGFTITSCCM